MIKYQVGYTMKILFIGINPHPGSYNQSVPFSNNKLFWYLLHEAGLLPEPRSFLKNIHLLKTLWETKFTQEYRLGLINIIDTASKNVTTLKYIQAIPGRKRILEAIFRYKPPVVCFVGKITYQMFKDIRTCEYGWQGPIDASKIYVMHFPHHGPARVRIEELKIVHQAAQEISGR